MRNELFTIGPVTIYGYGLMIGIGFLAGLITACNRAKKFGLDSDIVYGLGFTSLIGGMLCAKLLYCIVEFKEFIKNPAMIFTSDGFVVYGGIIGGVILGYTYCRLKKVQFLKYFDLVMPSIAIAQGFGRLGCTLAGCCYGRETSSAFGITYHESLIAPNGVKLIPTQIISSAGDFLIAVILIIYADRIYKSLGEKATGKVGLLYVIMYSVGRFFIEFLRNDYRGNIGIFSTSQCIAVVLLIIVLGVFFVKHRIEVKNAENKTL